MALASLPITLIQSNIVWEDKEKNLIHFEHKIKSSAVENSIVVLPEMFTTGFTMNTKSFAEGMDGVTVNWMKTCAKEKKIIITGSVIIKENQSFFNRMLWVLPNEQIFYYDKRHLFTYGSAQESQYYKAGDKRLIVQVNEWKINLQICYDIRFPVWLRQKKNMQEAEYDVMIVVANWPAVRSYHWKHLLIARAIENQCFVIAVNRVGLDGSALAYSGDSMVINPLGEVLYTKANEEDIYTYVLDKNTLTQIRSSYPFLKDADSFNIV